MGVENKAKTAAENVDASSSDEIPEEISEILKGIPSENREDTKKALVRSFEMIGNYSPETVVLKKITPEHITKYLSDSGENMRLGYRERKHNKIFIFALVIAALVFFTIWIFLLKNNPNLLENLISIVVGLVAGAFGGYGVGRRKRKDGD